MWSIIFLIFFYALQMAGREVRSRTIPRGKSLSNHYPIAMLLFLASFACLWLSGATYPLRIHP